MTLGYFLTRNDVEQHYEKVGSEIFRHSIGRRVLVVTNVRDFKERRWEPESPDQLLDAVKRRLSRVAGDQRITAVPAIHSTISRKGPDDGILHDLVIDIDAKQSPLLCKEATSHAISFLAEKDIPLAVKFSGGVGYHVIIPGNAFPSKIDGHPMSKVFPKVSEALHRRIIKVLLDNMGKTLERGIKVDMSMSQPDHLLRAPYSVHEMTGLVSTPLTVAEYKSFQPRQAMVGRTETLKGWWPEERENEKLAALCAELEWWKFPAVKRTATRPTFIFPARLADLQRMRDALRSHAEAHVVAHVRAHMPGTRVPPQLERPPWPENSQFPPGKEARFTIGRGVAKELHIDLRSRMGSLSFLPGEADAKFILEVAFTKLAAASARISDGWIGDFSRKVDGSFSMGNASAHAHYANGLTYNLDISTVTGAIEIRLSRSHPISKAVISTTTGKIALRWEEDKGEPYGGPQPGTFEVKTETGSVMIEPPPKPAGIRVEVTPLATQKVNQANWTTRSRNGFTIAESVGFDDSHPRYHVSVSGLVPRVSLG